MISKRNIGGVKAKAALAAAALAVWGGVAAAQVSIWGTNTAVQAPWSDPANWDAAPSVGTTTDVVFFSGPGVAVENGVNVGTTNDLSGLTLNTLTINGSGPTAAGAGSSLRLAGNTVTFSGANAAINVNSAYGNGGSGGLTVNISHALNFASDTTITYSTGGANVNLAGPFSGAGNVTFVGNLNSRPLNPTVAAQGFTGNITISKGVLQMAQVTNLLGSAATQTVTMTPGTVMQATTWNGAANIPQTLVVNGTGTGSGALNIVGVNFGSMNIGGLNVATDSTINIARNASAGASLYTATLTRGLFGSGNLVKNGDIILATSVANSPYTGNITVNAGRLQGTGNQNLFGTGNGGLQTVSIGANGQVLVNMSNAAYNQPQTFVVNSDGTFGQTGGLALTRINFGSPAIGALVIDTGGTISLEQETGQAIGTRSVTVTRGLHGAGKLTKFGTASLAVTQTGTFTGDILVASGILTTGGARSNVLGTNTAGTQAVTVAANGRVTFDMANAAYSHAQTFVINGNGTGTLTGALIANNVNFGVGTLGGINVATDASVNVILNSSPDNNTRGIAVANGLQGAGNLTKLGNGVMYLNGATGTFTGNVNVNGGVLQLGAQTNVLGPNASGTQTVTVPATGGVNLNGTGSAPQTFSIIGTGTGAAAGALSKIGSGTYTIGSVALTGDATISVASGGVLSLSSTATLNGSNTLTKSGAGTLVVGQSVGSPFTGNINVTAGTLQINQGNSVGAGPNVVTVSAGASVLANNLFAQRSYPQLFTISGTGTGTGALVMSQMDNFGPNSSIGGLTLAANATVTLSRNGNVGNNPNTGLRVLTPLAGAGNLTKSGDAALYLEGASSTYGGTVTVTGGTLGVNADAALGTASVVLRNGSTLSVSVSQSLPGGLTLDTGGGTVSTSGAVNATIAGSIGGAGSLTKAGTGTVTLTGSSTASGPVTVSEGRLNVGNGGTSGSLGTGDVSVAAGGSLVFDRSDSVSYGNNISASGGVMQARGGGTTTLTGSLLGFVGDVEVATPGTRMIVNSPLRPVTGSLVVTGPGASFQFAVPVGTVGYTGVGRFSAIDVGNSTTVAVSPVTRTTDNATVLVTSSLNTNADSGFLDLGNGDLIVKGAGAAGLATLNASVRAWITGGNGFGVGSTVANPTTNYTTLGVLLNDTGFGFDRWSSYDAISLASSDAVVKYTYVGDTDLNGVLDARDFSAVLNGFSNGLGGWQNGDVDYSGTTDASDWSLFLSAYAAYTAPSSTLIPLGDGQYAGPENSVPEPAAAGLLLAATPLLSRRRRA